ncbi:hypothetical protein [Microbispora corallina]|uniref:hypothetical protein n=1 Tax=Microbispora corallina TaxID=83302 RepID=UPI00194F29AA|nr:hypothetical protein [Microbispora corallina]
MTPGKTEQVNADEVVKDQETGVFRLVRRGEVVRTVPAGTRIRVTEVTEIISPTGAQLPIRRSR